LKEGDEREGTKPRINKKKLKIKIKMQ